MKCKPDYTLYLVTDREILGEKDLVSCVEEAIHGGVTVVQLREKDTSSREFYELACRVKIVTDRHQVPLIINDRLDIAMAVDAAGVHLGQSDLPAGIARSLLGPDKLLGVSTATVEEAQLAEQAGADYIGVGALFTTSTKANTRKVTPEGLAEICRAVEIPAVAIGGINHDNLQLIRDTGIDGVAVVSAILGKDDVQSAARELRKIWGER